MNIPNKFIVHCSDSDIPEHDDISVIRKWHVEERGWSDVGYHLFIKKDGSIQHGRPFDKVGAHCLGQNDQSIGICLSGKKKFTPQQFKALRESIEMLSPIYDIDPTETYGHYKFADKTCPNFSVEKLLNIWYGLAEHI